MSGDPVLMQQIEFHNRTRGFEYRLLSRNTYRAIQDDVHVTDYPIHDFGIYGPVAYVWPREGYARRAEAAKGYFQVDAPTVGKYRTLYARCWEREGMRREHWPGP